MVRHFPINETVAVDFKRGIFYALPNIPRTFVRQDADDLAGKMLDASRIAKLPRPQHMFYVTELTPDNYTVSIHISQLGELATLTSLGFFPPNPPTT